MGTTQSASTLIDSKATRKRQFCHNLVVEHWNISSLTGKEQEIVEEAKLIPWMFLASFQRSVVNLTLWRCEMGGNSSTLALNQHSLPKLD